MLLYTVFIAELSLYKHVCMVSHANTSVAGWMNIELDQS